jgi:hypothetical protein
VSGIVSYPARVGQAGSGTLTTRFLWVGQILRQYLDGGPYTYPVEQLFHLKIPHGDTAVRPIVRLRIIKNYPQSLVPLRRIPVNTNPPAQFRVPGRGFPAFNAVYYGISFIE